VKAQDYPIAHFEFLSKLTNALDELPAQLLEHSYNSEHFGSWTFSVRYKGNVVRVSFDGRDQVIYVAYSSDRKPPYQFIAELQAESLEDDGVFSNSALETLIEYIKLPSSNWPAGAA